MRLREQSPICRGALGSHLPQFRQAHTSTHLERVPPTSQAGSQAHIWKYLFPFVGMEISQPPGREGRQPQLQSLHYVSGLQLRADVANPPHPKPATAGLDGAQGPWGAQE
jgi:hypothetical protein